MLQLFNHLRDKSYLRMPPQINYLLRTIKENTDYFINYWQRMNWSVRNDHILVGLLTELSSIATNPLDIYDSVRNVLSNKNMTRGIASSVSYGRVQPKSYFYGIGCQEIIVEQSFDDSIEQIFNKHYTKWESVRVLYHPFTSMDYQLANGKQRHSGEKGLCIIKVDLALLYTQYRMWRLDEIRSTYEDGTVKSMNNFIHTYPIVNMLKSHIEQVWFNRIINYTLGSPISDNLPDYRSGYINIYNSLNETTETLIEYFTKGKIDFHAILSAVPGIYTKNMKSFLIQDNVLLTQQLKLPWLLANLPFISWLVRLELIYGTGGNKAFLQDILRDHRSYLNNRLYDTVKGLDDKETINYINENIIDIIQTL